MRLAAVAGTAAFAAGRALLAATVPFQGLVNRTRVTHAFINRQARLILAADGHGRAAGFMAAWAPLIDRGSDWADGGWRNVTHMYDPRRERGLWEWSAATVVCEQYFDRAVRAWRQGAARRTAFLLGAAAHIVQDLCVPHHAAARLLDGHTVFEDLGARLCQAFPVYHGGDYGIARTPAGWVRANACTALEYLPLATGGAGPEQMAEAIGDLLPLAQRTTAGFIAHFFDSVGR